jgi:hypothetical protein
MKTTLLKIYDYLFAYFTSVEWQRTILTLKIISLIISGLLFIAVVFLIFRIRANIKKSLEMMVESVAAPGLPKKAMVKKWESVLEKLEKGDENSYKLAVIEADKIFDDILKRIGYQGEDMGERLKQITSAQLSNIDEVWQAHKVRNQIVHNPDFHLTHTQAKRAVEIYQRALEDLEAI